MYPWYCLPCHQHTSRRDRKRSTLLGMFLPQQQSHGRLHELYAATDHATTLLTRHGVLLRMQQLDVTYQAVANSRGDRNDALKQESLAITQQCFVCGAVRTPIRGICCWYTRQRRTACRALITHESDAHLMQHVCAHTGRVSVVWTRAASTLSDAVAILY